MNNTITNDATNGNAGCRVRVLPGSVLSVLPKQSALPTTPPPKPSYLCKIAIVGDAKGGKSSLVQKFIYRRYANGGSHDDNNIVIHSWNSGLNTFTSASSLLHVGQENFDAGYEACKRLKTLYNAENILILDTQYGNNMGLVARGSGCQEYIGINNTLLMYVPGTNIEIASEPNVRQL